MPLTVLSIAYPFAPVGPCAVGGAEQVLSDLDEALVADGQVSLVAACEGSRPAGQLFSFPKPDVEVLDEEARRWGRKQFRAAIDKALASHRVDLIHMHGIDFYQYALPPDVPTLVTLHMPLSWYPEDAWARHRGLVQFQCVSESQRRSASGPMRDVPVVENGVVLPAISDQRWKADYAVVLGRICPEKNFHEALAAGTLAGTSVMLGGQVFPYPEHKQYFAQKLEPLLQANAAGVQHRFLGPLSPERRQRMLAEAKCLLHPTLAPETSSLVAMEALAAGTPVVAYRSGALSEIVEDGVTGFLVDGVREMAAAIGRVHTISPGACRRAAEQRFSRERMVRDYFGLYSKLVEKRLPEKVYA